MSAISFHFTSLREKFCFSGTNSHCVVYLPEQGNTHAPVSNADHGHLYPLAAHLPLGAIQRQLHLFALAVHLPDVIGAHRRDPLPARGVIATLAGNLTRWAA